MTVIDYLPLGKEVWPNVLLSQTKKCIISKVMACVTDVLTLNALESTAEEKWSVEAAGVQ